MKNVVTICMAACIVLIIAPMKSQSNDSTLKTRYERETLMLEGNKDQYSKNKEWKRIGIFKPKIEEEFSLASTESKEEIKIFRKQRRRGTVLLIAGGVVFLSAALVAPIITIPVFIGTFGTGIGTYYSGAFDLHKSRRHLQKAVWLRNRDVLAKN